MKIEIMTEPHFTEIDTDASVVLAEVYNPVRIRTDDGLEFGICCRDHGIEVVRVTGDPGGVLVCSIEQSLEGSTRLEERRK